MRVPRKIWGLIDALEAAQASGGRLRITHAEGNRTAMLHRFGVCMTAVKNGYLEFVSGPIQIEAVFKLTLKGVKFLEKEGQNSPL